MAGRMPPPTRSMIDVEPLTAASFRRFGRVIENPLGSLSPAIPKTPDVAPDDSRDPTEDVKLPANAVAANQGTAVKLQDVSSLIDHYGAAKRTDERGAKIKSRVSFSMFCCRPRLLTATVPDAVQAETGVNEQLISCPLTAGDLLAHGQSHARAESIEAYLPIPVLERHPYTSQTFIPLGLAAADADSCYLVAVAETSDGGTPHDPDERRGDGPPDPLTLRAFVASGDQAVTYAAGTWHAPMIVLGRRSVDFVVVQYVNGVPSDDCQEVEMGGEAQGPLRRGGTGLGVRLRLPARCLRERSEAGAKL